MKPRRKSTAHTGTPGLIRANRGARGKTRVLRALNSFSSVEHARQQARRMSILPPNVQEVIDNRVSTIAGEQLVIVKRLLAAGLVYRLPNWWGVGTVSRDALGDAGRARVSMVPKGRGERFIRDRKRQSVPVPCIWSDFSFDARTLAMAQRQGIPLETSHIDQAVTNCDEMAEDMVVYGGPSVNGLSIPGILSTTSTYTFTAGSWLTATGEQIVTDVRNMLETQRVNGFTRRQELIIPGNYNSRLDDDYKAGSDRTIRERLELLTTPDGSKLTITVSDRYPANTTTMIQMTPDVIDLVYGQGPVSFSWTDGPELETFWYVVACIVPRIFPNYNGKYGVLKGTP